ncbi:MAG: hypothetical protein FD180_4980 [Planctomycetota bacterium]|nr:MAG: hypothetical protein FD180_4980 [Planctomycetota bacterium]
MSAISLRLPDSIHKRLREVAQREHISINQLIATAVAEKLSALLTFEILEKRAQKGRRSKFLRVLRRVRPTAPMESDR